MSRLSFRPRPLDIHKKLPIVKSIKEFEDDDVPTATSTRNSQLQRIAAEAENEVQHTYTRKSTQEIPIPQFNVVDTYERDYSRTFNQPNSYVRGRGARAELGEFVEYDLDNEDEDWLHEFNNEKKALSSEKLELLLFKLEVLDHKARERAGIITPTLIGPIPAILQFDSASEALHSLSIRSAILQSVYNYWRRKRERWQKPVLRRLQPPPPVNDTNPYNVFRPREKAHKLHTRRMQRRENNVQSFEKLRQIFKDLDTLYFKMRPIVARNMIKDIFREVRRNLDQAKTIVGALIKREEKKRELTETEVKFQQYRMKHKHEAQFVDDGIALPGFSAAYCKFGSSEDDLMDSDDGTNFHPRPYGRFATTRNPSYMDSKLTMVPRGNMKRILKREHLTPAWLPRKDPHEPILLFTKPLDLEKLAVAGIVPPSDPPIENGTMLPIENGIKAQYRFHGRIGRGGRIIFDRCNPMLRAPTGPDISSYSPVTKKPPPHG